VAKPLGILADKPVGVGQYLVVSAAGMGAQAL
jgi:hypothetical protein